MNANDDAVDLAARLLGDRPRTEEEALDALGTLICTLSHAGDCPARHCGECLCDRSEVIQLLDEHGRGV